MRYTGLFCIRWILYKKNLYILCRYIKIDHISKTESCTKKNSWTRKSLSYMRIIPVNLASFEQLFFDRWHTRSATDQKIIIVQEWSNLQERCALIYQWFFSLWVFFCATFSFLDIVDFVHSQFWWHTHLVSVCDLMYTKSSTYTYIKSTTSQKLKVALKKLMN